MPTLHVVGNLSGIDSAVWMNYREKPMRKYKLSFMLKRIINQSAWEKNDFHAVRQNINMFVINNSHFFYCQNVADKFIVF